ncbi:MAG: Hpt domain-containing protein [Pseudomonadota bacterium]
MGQELPIVDDQYLERLGRHLGEDALGEILADGGLELADRRARLAELIGTEDLPAIAAIAHDLVAVAGHLGLAALSKDAAALERGARAPCRPCPGRTRRDGDVGAPVYRLLGTIDISLNALAERCAHMR